MGTSFDSFDLENFWEKSAYADKEYVDDPLTDGKVALVERELGYKLPNGYIELLKSQNGGIPNKTNHPTTQPTSWAQDHIAITGIYAIGKDRRCPLCGEFGSRFWIEEWGYPPFGIYFADCPSAGHDMILLDYRKCGPQGEPQVVHVDQERNYRIIFIAESFEAFIRGLIDDSRYDTSADDLKNALAKIESGSFSTLLASLITRCHEIDFGPIVRNACRKLTTDKGFFAMHADEMSMLLYDIQFYLYTQAHAVPDKGTFLQVYPKLISFGDGELTTEGYAPDFVKDWMDDRISRGEIVRALAGNLTFSDDFFKTFVSKVNEFK